MLRPAQKIAPLLFCSGACALLYQTVWLREFRLVFGASTAASAAVLAMFMGGLGAGGLVLGKRAESKPSPLTYYGNLEIGVAVLTGLTPILVDASRFLYAALGGTDSLGMGIGTVVRLIFSAIVLVPVTFLMGGTLPAAARAAETDDDVGRRNLALLYGVNTLGAVFGALATTFALLEVFGGRLLLWMCCLLNVLLGLLARAIARGLDDDEMVREKASSKQGSSSKQASSDKASSDKASSEKPVSEKPASGKAPSEKGPSDSSDAAAVPALFVLISAAIVGFAFLLMELVFYRMLAPILGGSSYTFGLILVFALLGVGLGGAAYPAIAKNRSITVRAFAFTCLLEALFFLVPFALGDRIALLALTLRPMRGLGFYALASGWAVIAAIVVLPAAFVSGVQFPLLMALLGRGRTNVARHVGLAYAWNTAGSIVGSLAGGFGLIPWLTAPGVWRLSAMVLVALGIAAVVISFRATARGEGARSGSASPNDQATRSAAKASESAGGRGVIALVGPVALAAACVVLAVSQGPTAGYRHSPIGAGRADYIVSGATTNLLRNWLNHRRRSIEWEADGVESSVALSTQSGYNFIVNGKVDGHARIDAGTQVMSGLIGAMLHPNPTRTLVVGLGTGSTAGWLGVVPTMERVDVVELEPAILHIARACAPVNQNVLENPKVHIAIGDARETLLTTKRKYDLIFSEPSNPYRAGIASLFTQEFYEASAKRLDNKGIFLQWLQAYEIDGQTVRTVYATLASVFPHVETWLSDSSDLILAASMEPIAHDAEILRARLTEEPFKSAVAHVWRMTDLEGFLAHHVATDAFTAAVAEQEHGFVSTDDHNLLEFSFARTVGKERTFSEDQVYEVAILRNEDRPDVTGKVDWAAVDDRRMAMFALHRRPPLANKRYNQKQARWADAWARYLRGDWGPWHAAWSAEKIEPRNVQDLEILSEGFADMGVEEAKSMIEKLRPYEPVEADVFLSRYHFRKGNLKEATDAAIAAIEGYRADPWPDLRVMDRFLGFVADTAGKDKVQGPRVFEALKEPFAVRMLEEDRLDVRTRIATAVDFDKLCLEAYLAYEPYVPFQLGFLRQRLLCYTLNNHPNKALAERELREFLEAESAPFSAGLVEETPPEDAPAMTTKPGEAGNRPPTEAPK